MARFADIESLEGWAAWFMSRDLAPEVYSKRASAQRQFLRFCLLADLTPLPASNRTLVLFTSYLAVNRFSPGSIDNYLQAIRQLHVENGFPHPLRDNTELARCLSGINRLLAPPAKPRLPVTPDIMVAIAAKLSPSNKTHMCFMAAAVVAFFGLLRKDNIGPKASRSFDSARDLRLCDVLLLSKNLLVVVVRRSKTRRLGSQPLLVKIPRAPPGSRFCPFSILASHVAALERDGAHADSPLFQTVHASSHRFSGNALSYGVFVSQLKKFLGVVGVDPSLFSGHSFRRGGSTTLGMEGHHALIRPAGDWRSQLGSDVYDLSPRGVDTAVAQALMCAFDSAPSRSDQPLVSESLIQQALLARQGSPPVDSVLGGGVPQNDSPVCETVPAPPPLPADRLRSAGRLRLATPLDG